MKRQRYTEGAIVRIPLKDGRFAYAQMIGKMQYAVFDLLTNSTDHDELGIVDKPVLFLVAVHKNAFTTGRWTIIDRKEVLPEYKNLPMQFIQDWDLSCSLYDPNTGEITPTTIDKCVCLERAAVWEPDQVEERILDHYSGRPNKYVEKEKLKWPHQLGVG